MTDAPMDKSGLADLQSVSDEIFDRWDKDMKPGKLLMALKGTVPNYDPRVTRIREALSHSPAIGAQGAVAWRSPLEIPDTKRGDYSYRIVAVKRAHSGQVVSFGAFYLNAMPLCFEDEDDSRPVTGWNSDDLIDDGPVYSELLGAGDELMGWCEFPKFGAAPPAVACLPDREAVAAFEEIKARVSRAREMLAEDYPQPDQSVTRASGHLLGVFCLTGKVEAALSDTAGVGELPIGTAVEVVFPEAEVGAQTLYIAGVTQAEPGMVEPEYWLSDTWPVKCRGDVSTDWKRETFTPLAALKSLETDGE